MYLISVLVEHPIIKISNSFYYVSDTFYEPGIRVKINFHNQNIIGFIVESQKTTKAKEELEKEFGFELKYLTDTIDEFPILNEELISLSKVVASRYNYPQIGVLQAMVPSALKPKSSALNKNSTINYNIFYHLNRNLLSEKLNRNEQRIIDKFSGQDYLLKKDLGKSKTLDTLIESGIIDVIKEEKYAYNINKIFDYEKNIVLTEEQQAAFDKVISTEKIGTLLYGVTGSGKTEVYIKLIEYFIKKGKSALILVPEIGLTPLMISRIVSYFDENIIAIMHSSLTDRQAYDQYRKMKNGDAKIVIGTRSAIFSPIKNLGLICIDEEHDDSYYQEENFPYSAIDIAFLRSKYNKDLKIVLGSATPSIESMAKAKAGKYEFAELKTRYSEVKLPKGTIVSTLDKNNFSSSSSVFTLPLIKKIRECLIKKQQVILLINSKGYSRSIYCRECGENFLCPKCNTQLFYHKVDNTLRCHHCEYKIKKPATCPKCGSRFFGNIGYGIEKVEEDFKKLFNENYLVLDGDRTKKSLQISTILKNFDDQKALVLIGTQLVAKGHDFKNVHLIGIMNADIGLTIPSYRSEENTYDLIAQVIGRGGRGDVRGEAIIQTSMIENYSIKYGCEQNYEEFYNHEIERRKKYKYPPFFYLIEIKMRSAKLPILVETTQNIANFIKADFPQANVMFNQNITEIGKFYCNSILVRIKNLKEINLTLKAMMDTFKNAKNFELKIVLNPR